MTTLNISVDGGNLRAEEERILSSFTQRLLTIATGSRERPQLSATAALNALRLPAVSVDERGTVVEINAAAADLFDNDLRLKEGRLFIRDAGARAHLKQSLDRLKEARDNGIDLEPIIVPRSDKYPVILRLWPFEEAVPEVRALITFNALGRRPGPPAAILAKTFRLTPSEARLACIIARGAPPDTAARELKISRETARNQLKSVFAKTDTHRQSELVALLMQVT
ncbi:MAG TPA: hypothetical protein VEK34_05120 [Methylocella sp.]|nr:hypothetical protein [Methylocella sp.]